MANVSSPFSLKETEELDLDSATKQNQIMNDWLFTSSKKRSANAISSLHYHTLVRGHATLLQRIADLQSLRLLLFHKYLTTFMSSKVFLETIRNVKYSPKIKVEEIVEGLGRNELEDSLMRNVETLDSLAQVVESLKVTIDKKIWKR